MLRSFALLAIPVLFSFGAAEEGCAPDASRLIDTFSNCLSSRYAIPCNWYPTQKDVSMYSLVSDSGNYFVRVDTYCGNTTIGTKASFNTGEFPNLSWRWRVHTLPTKARENVRKLADSGAGVYVIFKGTLRLNRMIKYVWSSTLPVGTVTQSPFNPRTKIVVLHSGSENLGEWLHEKVNVNADFRRLFEDEPPEVEAIAFMSDADNTRSSARADYDDFRICK